MNSPGFAAEFNTYNQFNGYFLSQSDPSNIIPGNQATSFGCPDYAPYNQFRPTLSYPSYNGGAPTSLLMHTAFLSQMSSSEGLHTPTPSSITPSMLSAHRTINEHSTYVSVAPSESILTTDGRVATMYGYVFHDPKF
jgi:hypothetical protein